MTLEQFLREHATLGNNELVLRTEIDPRTKQVTAIFEDTDASGRTAHIRVEKDKVVFMSWDDNAGGHKPELPSVAAAKEKTAKEAEKAKNKEQHDAALQAVDEDEERREREAQEAEQTEVAESEGAEVEAPVTVTSSQQLKGRKPVDTKGKK